jgi:hypothetical protein
MTNPNIIEEEALMKLRWWQVQSLADTYSNDQELGAKVRELISKTENTK